MSFYDRLIVETELERNAMLAIPFIQQGAAGLLSLQSYQAFLG